MPRLFVVFLALGLSASLGCWHREVRDLNPGDPEPAHRESPPAAPPEAAPEIEVAGEAVPVVDPLPIPDYLQKGIRWLAEAQHESGGWGAGSHSRQHIRNPHEVKTDPATTAFAAQALLRAGHTPVSGAHKATVRAATEHLVRVLEEAPAEGPRITDRTGTQPQSKLGALVDTSMTVQYLSRVLTEIPTDDPLHARVDGALEKCLAKLEASQQQNGSWGSGGWAGVLQSSLGCSALELAKVAGKEVDEERLANARDHLKGNYDAGSRQATAADGAGVELYAFATSQRAAAGEAVAAKQLIDEAKAEGRLTQDAPVTAENLIAAGGISSSQANIMFQAFGDNETQLARLDDDDLLRGFGSNGGEEFLSYLLTSETLVLHGGEPWTQWNVKMHDLLAKIQSPDGSWTGHHCITSPVFCTAAVVQCLTADRDANLLREIATGVAVSKK